MMDETDTLFYTLFDKCFTRDVLYLSNICYLNFISASKYIINIIIHYIKDIICVEH